MVRRGSARAAAIALTVVVLAAGCGSSGNSANKTTTTGGVGGTSGTTAPKLSTALGTGVTATTIKVGVVEPDFTCFQQFVDQIRVNEQQVWAAYFKAINDAGGINGRQLVMDFKKFCPVPGTGVQAATMCTQFTEDDKVFAVLGTLADLSGDTEICVAKQHKTVLISYLLDGAWIDQAPPGLMLSPQISKERRVNVTLELLKKQHTLDGKKVAILGESVTKAAVDSTVVPGVKALGVPTGSTAILTINGSDTTAAQAQLDSFIEKWKNEGVQALFMVGQQVSSKQFVEKIKKQMPDLQLISDNGEVGGYGSDYVVDHIKPDPYEGILVANGQSGDQYDSGAHYKFCADIWNKYITYRPASRWDTVIPGPNKKTIDDHGIMTDACALSQMFAEIAKKAGPNLNNDTWSYAANHYGPIEIMDTLYASIHQGKYDADDTWRLGEFDSSIGQKGDMKPLTPLEDVPGS
jgi:ABC-type branched-subunit amino acid transport system substrate-binding protein